MRNIANREVTQELVDLLVPAHARTTCATTGVGLDNGYQNDQGMPRCLRCYLLRNVGRKTDELAVAVVVMGQVRTREVVETRHIPMRD